MFVVVLFVPVVVTNTDYSLFSASRYSYKSSSNEQKKANLLSTYCLNVNANSKKTYVTSLIRLVKCCSCKPMQLPHQRALEHSVKSGCYAIYTRALSMTNSRNSRITFSY